MSNDDLLIEILLRLPVISLHVIKYVSKRWLSLITATNITLRQCQISKLDPPTGFFLWRPKRAFGDPSIRQLGFKYDFVSLDTIVPSKRSTTISMGFEAPCVDFLILQSCNGLLLLGCEHDYDYPFKFYICNPFLKLFKMLPQCDDLKLSESFNVTGMILAFDPTRSPHYKVIKTVVEHVYNGGVLFVHIIITLQKQTIGVFVVIAFLTKVFMVLKRDYIGITPFTG
ncbi:F-box protein-like protein isoform X1 [Tanacetum coccineum]|uniref:F-box protein-like protein isoform X1 n=1 Tax=Tanacetum coccineum TaxID=301880 RepID=A0ABQ4ZF14_9ASTR